MTRSSSHDHRRLPLRILGVNAGDHGNVVVAGMLGVAAVIEVLVRGDASGIRLALSLLLALATTAPLALVTAHWAASTTGVAAAFVSLLVEPRLTVAGLVAVTAMFYYVARHRNRRLVLALLAPLVLVAIGGLFSVSGPAESDAVVDTDQGPVANAPEPDDPNEANLYPLLVAGASLGAAAVGLFRRSEITEAEIQVQEAHFAEELAEHSARGERARIARELHDVVAHRISSIAVQAETARLTTPGLTPEGTRQLVAIGDSAREALSEMRRLLGVLRKDVDATGGRQPQPGIGQLPQLLDEARDLSGANTRLIVSGQMEPLDPGVELTAFRIVQESLTNARRHAPGAPVDVELHYGEETLRLQVRDAGPGSIDPDAGLGLVGMRERAAAVGGRLTVDSRSAGGFVVTATLPRVPVDQAAASVDSD